MSQWKQRGRKWSDDSWSENSWEWSNSKSARSDYSKGTGHSEDSDWSDGKGQHRGEDGSWKRTNSWSREQDNHVEQDWKRARQADDSTSEQQTNNGAGREASGWSSEHDAGSNPPAKPAPKKVPARAHIVAKREKSAPPEVEVNGIDFMSQPKTGVVVAPKKRAKKEGQTLEEKHGSSEVQMDHITDLHPLFNVAPPEVLAEPIAQENALASVELQIEQAFQDYQERSLSMEQQMEEMASQEQIAPPEPQQGHALEQEVQQDSGDALASQDENQARAKEGSADVSQWASGFAAALKARLAKAAGGAEASESKGKGKKAFSKAKPPEGPLAAKASSAWTPRLPVKESPQVQGAVSHASAMAANGQEALAEPGLASAMAANGQEVQRNVGLASAMAALDADLAAMAAAAEEAARPAQAPRVQPCWSFLMTGFCELGDACPCIHGTGEEPIAPKQKPPANSKALQPCWEFVMTGSCAAGASCPSIHGKGSRGNDDEMLREEDLLAVSVTEPSSSSSRNARNGRKSKWDADETAPVGLGALAATAMQPLAIAPAPAPTPVQDGWVMLSPEDAETLASTKAAFNWKTTMCKQVAAGGICPQPQFCRFAHSQAEAMRPGQFAQQVRRLQAAPEAWLQAGAAVGAEGVAVPTATQPSVIAATVPVKPRAKSDCEICWPFFQDGFCKNEAACPMSHNLDDLHAAMTGGAAPGLEGLQASMAAGAGAEAVDKPEAPLELEWPELAPQEAPLPTPGLAGAGLPAEIGLPVAGADGDISWVPVPPDQLELLAGSKEAFNYKSVSCRHFTQFGKCGMGSRCRFAHGDTELKMPGEMQRMARQMQAVPASWVSLLTGEGDQRGAARVKTEICRHFEKTGTCARGDGCNFAHGAEELGVAPVPTHAKPSSLESSVKICRHFLTGHCNFGAQCSFAHVSPEEAALLK